MAFPQLPASPVPFTVAEYFPMPGISPYTDDRQHAVSLAYVVPVTGTCDPRQDALEVTWLSPEEAAGEEISREMEGGRVSVRLVRGILTVWVFDASSKAPASSTVSARGSRLAFASPGRSAVSIASAGSRTVPASVNGSPSGWSPGGVTTK